MMTTDETYTMADFIRENGITMEVEPAYGNPHMVDSMPPGSSHYSCTLSLEDGSYIEIPFSMGPALTREPQIAEVLDCLASDSSGVENSPDFSDWCDEYGYNDDSIRAKEIFDTVTDQAEQLKAWLGEAAYETLLWHTERE